MVDIHRRMGEKQREPFDNTNPFGFPFRNKNVASKKSPVELEAVWCVGQPRHRVRSGAVNLAAGLGGRTADRFGHPRAVSRADAAKNPRPAARRGDFFGRESFLAFYPGLTAPVISIFWPGASNGGAMFGGKEK